MTAKWRIMGVGVLALAALGVGWLQTSGQDKPSKGKEEAKEKEKDKDKDKQDAPEVAVRKTADAFLAAFNKHDAKAVAALWTDEGEMVTSDGEEMRGRKAIEEGYAAFFKENPKVKAEVTITGVRLLGRGTASEEGRVAVTLAPNKEPSVSSYTVLHVKDDDGWKMASVREYEASAAELISLKDAEWLIGDWVAKQNEAEAKLSYEWNDAKAYIIGKYTVTRKDKSVATGTQVLGKGNEGQLRSWQFDSTGAVGEWAWWRDKDNWVVESAETLPGGGELSATHLITPMGKDAFLWQTVARSLGETPLPDLPPLKVERVKAKK